MLCIRIPCIVIFVTPSAKKVKSGTPFIFVLMTDKPMISIYVHISIALPAFGTRTELAAWFMFQVFHDTAP